MERTKIKGYRENMLHSKRILAGATGDHGNLHAYRVRFDSITAAESKVLRAIVS